MKRKIFMLACLASSVLVDAQSLRERLEGNSVVPLIAAHRGGFYDSLPENSLSAIEYTRANTIEPVMVEFDVRKSKDGTLFILHDETLERTTNGKGKIEESEDAYLKSLNLENSNGKLTKERIPTFEELLSYVKTNSLLLMLDVKANVWQEALRMLQVHGLVNRSIVLTFSPKDTKKVHDLSPDILISCLVRNETDWATLEGLSIPNDKLLAYVNDNASETLLTKLKNNNIRLLRDISENTKNDGKALDGESYRSILFKMKTGILITDFPVEVSGETTPH